MSIYNDIWPVVNYVCFGHGGGGGGGGGICQWLSRVKIIIQTHLASDPTKSLSMVIQKSSYLLLSSSRFKTQKCVKTPSDLDGRLAWAFTSNVDQSDFGRFDISLHKLLIHLTSYFSGFKNTLDVPRIPTNTWTPKEQPTNQWPKVNTVSSDQGHRLTWCLDNSHIDGYTLWMWLHLFW